MQVKAAAAALSPGPQEAGAVKKTRRGKRGGKKHAAEAELKSAERQKKLPGRHSLDALLHTATQGGIQLSTLRHMVISEDLPTPKVFPEPHPSLPQRPGAQCPASVWLDKHHTCEHEEKPSQHFHGAPALSKKLRRPQTADICRVVRLLM